MKQNIKVYVDNVEIDIKTTSSVKIKKQLKDIKEYSKIKTSFTKPVSALFTQSNHKLFSNAFNINEVGGWDKNSRPVARIESNNETVLSGLMKLSAIKKDCYEIVIYAENINLDSLFGDELIRGNSDSSKDITFTNQYSFDFTRPNIRTKFATTPRQDGKGINYGFADLTGDSSFSSDRLMIPSIAARELLEETLNSIGKTLTVSTGIEKYFNHLYIPFNSEYKELTNSWQYGKYTATEEDVTRKDVFVDLRLIEGLKCNYDKIQDIPTETSSSRYYVDLPNDIGEYKVSFTCSVRKSSEKGTGTDDPEVKPKIYIHTAGIYPYVTTELELSNTGADPDAGITLSGTTYHEATFEATFKLSGGDNTMRIGFQTNELPNDEGPLLCNPNGSTHVEITKLDSYYNEDDVNVISANNILPTEYKKKELYNDVVKFFNATATVEGDNIHLQTSDEFNINRNPIVKDWSDKIHEDEIELSTLKTNKSEIIQYKFAESDDLYNEDYRAKYDNSINDFLRTEDDKTTVTTELSIGNTIRVDNFSRLLNNDGEYNTKLKPRFLFIGSYNIWQYDQFGLDTQGSRDTSITYLHVLSTRFSEYTTETDNLFIGFRNEDNYSESIFKRADTNGNLYNKFYEKNEELTANDDLIFLKSKFNLTPKDFAEVEFNDIIFVNTAKHGAAYYRLNEITNYEVGGNKHVDVELIQIDLTLLDDLAFEAEEVTLNQVSLSSDGEATKESFQAVSGSSGSGLTSDEVQALIDASLAGVSLNIIKGRLINLLSRNVSISLTGFTETPIVSHLEVYRYEEIISGNWQKMEVLYKYNSATPLTSSNLSFEIDSTESLTGIIIEYVIQ